MAKKKTFTCKYLLIYKVAIIVIMIMIIIIIIVIIDCKYLLI